VSGKSDTLLARHDPPLNPRKQIWHQTTHEIPGNEFNLETF